VVLASRAGDAWKRLERRGPPPGRSVGPAVPSLAVKTLVGLEHNASEWKYF